MSKKRDQPKQASKPQARGGQGGKPPAPVVDDSRRYVVRILMTSDWHIGQGAGIPGFIDSLVARDEHDLPFVPAKTLTGILRDGCETLAFALDEGDAEGAWHELVLLLFGDEPAKAQEPRRHRPLEAVLSVRPAFLPVALRKMLAQKKMSRFRRALTFLKPGVAIDPDSGAAQHGTYRIFEMGRVETILEGTAAIEAGVLSAAGNYQQAIEDFLVCGAAMAERIGGDRRRGAGSCRIRLSARQGGQAAEVELALPKAAERLERIAAARGQERPQKAKALRAAIDAILRKIAVEPPAGTELLPSDGDFRDLPIALQLELPLSAPRRVVGNVNETLDYVPGTYLLDPLIRALRSQGHDARQAIRRGDLRVSNLTLDVDEQRGLPVPFALAIDKLAGRLDRADKPYNLLVERPPGTIQAKQVRDGVVAWTDTPGEPPRWARVETVVRTHNTINDEVQRPTEEEGGVFSIEALAAGQVLRGVIRMRAAMAGQVEAAVRALKGKNLRLGRAKKDDYGLATLQQVGELESGLAAQPIGSDGLLVVWCLSDALLPATTLDTDCTRDCLRAALESLLSVKLGDPASTAGTRIDAIRSVRVDGWHVGWGLPRPSLVGVAGGSCAVFELSPGCTAPDAATLARLARHGIGERRAEGFGEIAVNPPLLMKALEKRSAQGGGKSDGVPPLPALRQADPAVWSLARLVEKEAWRSLVHDAIWAKASDTDARRAALGLSAGSPSMSQIGGMRRAFQRMLADEKPERVIDWTKTVRARGQKGRNIGWNDDGLTRLEALVRLQSPDIWGVLDIKVDALPSLTEGGPAASRSALWWEAVCGFVEAAIHAHARQPEEASETKVAAE